MKEVTSNESDVSESSENNRSDPSPPVSLSPEISRPKHTVKIQQQQQSQQQTNAKKSKGKGGILVNKNEPVMVKEVEVVEESNHFVEIHPKDAVEIHRLTGKEHEDKSTKNFRKNKPAKETPPVSPKNQPAKAAVEAKPVEEKIVKKKKNEQQQAVSMIDGISMVTDEAGIKPIIRELSRADLTKNQIQVLIDFLLNKQSDTITKDPTEWTEGKSDLMQKLKKQLQEKEAQLKNEQDALSGMQLKLKELRSELNNEKIQFNANLKAHVEQLQNYRSEIKTLQSEIQFLNEKHNNEKQTMLGSFKQLQAQNDILKAKETSVNVQQIQSENQQLQTELVNKNQQIIELNVLIDENRQKEVRLSSRFFAPLNITFLFRPVGSVQSKVE